MSDSSLATSVLQDSCEDTLIFKADGRPPHPGINISCIVLWNFELCFLSGSSEAGQSCGDQGRAVWALFSKPQQTAGTAAKPQLSPCQSLHANGWFFLVSALPEVVVYSHVPTSGMRDNMEKSCLAFPVVVPTHMFRQSELAWKQEVVCFSYSAQPFCFNATDCILPGGAVRTISSLSEWKNMERLSNTLFISRVIHVIGSYFVSEIIVLSNSSTSIISKLLKTIGVALVKWNVVFSYICPTRYGITICPRILANFY